MDIYLKQAILQVVDRELGDPIYSQQVLDLTNGNTRDYLTNKIKKLSSAQSKTGVLRQDAELASFLRDATADFIGASQRLVEKWYTVYQKKVTMHRVRMRLLSCMNKMRKLTWLFFEGRLSSSLHPLCQCWRGTIDESTDYSPIDSIE